MTDSADTNATNQYKQMEREVIDAFETWHRFHEDLLRLGDFTTWLAQNDSQVNLVTFFNLDTENTEGYDQALTHQIEFLDNVKALLQQTTDMFREYQEQKKSEDTEGSTSE